MEPRFEVTGGINRSVEDVFDAVVNPDKLSAYFTTGGAQGRIEPGATVRWAFHDYPGSFLVEVIEVVSNQKIVLEWEGEEDGGEPYRTRVTMLFKPADDGRTIVTIAEEGWRPTPGGLKASYGNCSGWMQMLCALKAWVEHGINLREGMFA